MYTEPAASEEDEGGCFRENMRLTRLFFLDFFPPLLSAFSSAAPPVNSISGNAAPMEFVLLFPPTCAMALLRVERGRSTWIRFPSNVSFPLTIKFVKPIGMANVGSPSSSFVAACDLFLFFCFVSGTRPTVTQKDLGAYAVLAVASPGASFAAEDVDGRRSASNASELE